MNFLNPLLITILKMIKYIFLLNIYKHKISICIIYVRKLLISKTAFLRIYQEFLFSNKSSHLILNIKTKMKSMQCIITIFLIKSSKLWRDNKAIYISKYQLCTCFAYTEHTCCQVQAFLFLYSIYNLIGNILGQFYWIRWMMSMSFVYNKQ